MTQAARRTSSGPGPETAGPVPLPSGSGLAVVAVGGNSLIKRGDRRSVEDQYSALCETMEHVAGMVALGWRVVITHGNGPQVGFILLRSEIAREVAGLHIVPLASCVADTQGAIGWQIQQALGNSLGKRGLPGGVVSLVTQTLVDEADPAFLDPDKPVGGFYAEDQLDGLERQYPHWTLKRDGDRGWRRVVASPVPLDCVELDAVRSLLAAGFHVVAGGGGGIPVVRREGGLAGVDAVVDKDLAASLMARRLGAELLVISTAVEQVELNHATPLRRPLGVVDLETMEAYLDQGHFAPGSMAPKIKAAVEFLRGGGGRVVITAPESLTLALTHGRGTHIIPSRRN